MKTHIPQLISVTHGPVNSTFMELNGRMNVNQELELMWK